MPIVVFLVRGIKIVYKFTLFYRMTGCNLLLYLLQVEFFTFTKVDFFGDTST